MQARKHRALKVIKGAKAGIPAPRRGMARPGRPGDIENLLERLDEEPAVDPTHGPDGAVARDTTGAAQRGRADLRRAVDDPVDDPMWADEPAPVDDPAAVEGPTDAVGPSAREDGTADPAVDGPDATAGSSAGKRMGTAEPMPPAEPASGGRRRILVGLLVAVLAAALAATGVHGHRWYADRAIEQARQQAMAAAKQASVNFISVSSASVDRDLQRISTGATGDFKEEFTRGRSQVRTAVVENKVESRGSVLRAGLVSGDRDRAVVLVAVDATVKNVKAPKGRPSHYRIQVDMVRDQDSGQWLVSRLQFVG
ncbi:hypothetical protein K7640_23990 [Micromonospora sp. PLK6-60]|uniref:hypothetical protein n=1 Tax=Micromonospora sp. PLK6-60 TaxID=2873383 RepID=UPI001CA67C63|nr:hypothetical protein [Micromonospora sp. PLK6-60]MBY8874894.1 hypothetical protein [Micromonospora sp. PLK6-60]